MTKAVNFLRGPWTIAVYTWREGMRKKTLIGFTLLSILVIFGSQFITAFLVPSGVKADVDTKLIKDICVTAISIFGVLITIFVSASVVPAEVENKVVYTVLSKPIRRFQYLLGKFLGIQLIVIINLALMGVLFVTALYFKERILSQMLMWSVLLTYFEFIIVSAFTFAVSCTSTSAVLPTIAGLFIFITGNLTEYLKDVATRAGQTDQVLDQWIGRIAQGLYWLLPNLQSFSLKNQVLYLQPNDPPQEIQIPYLMAYGLFYALSGFILAYWIFRRKEM
jgi:ABC-type transport system involved in multi-copper enzyme maturation permease subunit